MIFSLPVVILPPAPFPISILVLPSLIADPALFPNNRLLFPEDILLPALLPIATFPPALDNGEDKVLVPIAIFSYDLVPRAPPSIDPLPMAMLLVATPPADVVTPLYKA